MEQHKTSSITSNNNNFSNADHQQHSEVTKENQLSIFDQVLNDDIFRIVLSFLNVSELMILAMVSKKLGIGQLSSEDYLWKEYYVNRVKVLNDNFKNQYRYQLLRKVDNTNLFEKYLHFDCDFKKHLIELGAEMALKSEQDYKKRTEYIEKLKQLEYGRVGFHTREEILACDLKIKYLQPQYKIIQIGKFCF